jgi:hypothetical protein
MPMTSAQRKALRATLMERAGGICPLCSQPLDVESLQIDHIIPTSAGGGDNIENLQPTHRRCNNRKSNRALTDDVLAMIRAPAPAYLKFIARLTPPLRAKLIKLAEREHRSLHSQIVYLLERAVADQP